jgi:hypothetical protein
MVGNCAALSETNAQSMTFGRVCLWSFGFKAVHHGNTVFTVAFATEHTN